MSAEKNPSLRQMAKDLKRARALVDTQGLQVALIEAWFAGASYGTESLAKSFQKSTKGAHK